MQQNGETLKTLCQVKEVRHQRTKCGRFHLHEVPRKSGQTQRLKEQWWLLRLGEGEMKSYSLMGTKFQFRKMEEF